MMDVEPVLTVADHAILDRGACPLCTTDEVTIWHRGDARCWQLEDEDEQ